KIIQQKWKKYTTILTNSFTKSTPLVQSVDQKQQDKSYNF
ncbi:39366_t:CDS:1, partial [Gigaspora margarita]